MPIRHRDFIYEKVYKYYEDEAKKIENKQEMSATKPPGMVPTYTAKKPPTG
jgi:hypothetical protein